MPVYGAHPVFPGWVGVDLESSVNQARTKAVGGQQASVPPPSMTGRGPLVLVWCVEADAGHLLLLLLLMFLGLRCCS